MLGFPGDEKNQPHTGANGGIGDVEGGKIDDAAAALLQVKIEKIHNGMAAGQEAVGEIAGDATKNQAESDLAGERVRTGAMSANKATRASAALLPLKRLHAAPVLPQ